MGQFATVELTSSPGSERLVRALRRLRCPEQAVAFYDEQSRRTPCTSRSSGTA